MHSQNPIEELFKVDAKVAVPSDVAELHPNFYLLAVEVDVMAPTVPSGSVIAVDPSVQPAGDGTEIGIVEVAGERYICRPMRAMGQVVLHFDGPGVRSVTLPSAMAKVVGAVVWISTSEVIGMVG